MDYPTRKVNQPKEILNMVPNSTLVIELKCMYTNVDTITNKREEFEIRVKQSCPDIIGLTEINPKNATPRPSVLKYSL